VDDPPLSIVGGEPLTPEVAQRLPENAVVRLLADRRSIRPVDEGDIVDVIPRAAGRPGDIRRLLVRTLALSRHRQLLPAVRIW
jgi:hypothetical protein